MQLCPMLRGTRFTILLASAFMAAQLCAANLSVLHSFGVNRRGGSDLYAGVILDAQGNLYSTAEFGGSREHGVVYKLSRAGRTWTETVLYNFQGAPDGATPHAAVLFDAAGNLYGTASEGGNVNGSCSSAGCGVVYRLSPNGNGGWSETVLYRFSGNDGTTPYAGLTLDAAGNLYGATYGGGPGGRGVVYRLSPSQSLPWTLTILHAFSGGDGSSPYATPVLDAAGNLLGTTYGGGNRNLGTVYKLAAGTWSHTILHTFRGGSDGANPFAGVVQDASGALYGTTSGGGTSNYGVAYKLAAHQTQWAESILHTFLGFPQDAGYPNGMVFDASGNLYGTSTGGGVDNPGTIFRLSPNGDGTWNESVLYSFTGGLDGAYPSVPPTVDAAGHVYGTTLWGGPSGDTTGGVVFEFVP